MNRFVIAAAALCLLSGTAAFAQNRDNRFDNNRNDHDNHQNDRHDNNNNHGPSHPNWRKGGHIERNDWNRGSKVDYRSHRLQAPPRGYEWRQVDNNYVLAAVATGVIASIILANQ